MALILKKDFPARRDRGSRVRVTREATYTYRAQNSQVLLFDRKILVFDITYSRDDDTIMTHARTGNEFASNHESHFVIRLDAIALKNERVTCKQDTCI